MDCVPFLLWVDRVPFVNIHDNIRIGGRCSFRKVIGGLSSLRNTGGLCSFRKFIGGLSSFRNTGGPCSLRYVQYTYWWTWFLS